MTVLTGMGDGAVGIDLIDDDLIHGAGLNHPLGGEGVGIHVWLRLHCRFVSITINGLYSFGMREDEVKHVGSRSSVWFSMATDNNLPVCAVRPGKVAISSGFESRPGKVGQPPGSESLEGRE